MPLAHEPSTPPKSASSKYAIQPSSHESAGGFRTSYRPMGPVPCREFFISRGGVQVAKQPQNPREERSFAEKPYSVGRGVAGGSKGFVALPTA